MANRVIDLWGEPIEVAIASADTGNASRTVIQTSPPGGGTPIHIHSREDEVLCVLDSDYAYYDGATWHLMTRESPVFLVRNQAHAYRNVGRRSGRMMVAPAPGGLDLTFADVAALSLPRDQTRFGEIGRMYGITVPPQDSVPPPPKID